MLMKIALRIQKVCRASKISILLGSALSGILFLAATAMSIVGGSLGFKYLYEYMAIVAADILAIGIFLGLSGEFLAIIIDRRGK